MTSLWNEIMSLNAVYNQIYYVTRTIFHRFETVGFTGLKSEHELSITLILIENIWNCFILCSIKYIGTIKNYWISWIIQKDR